MCPRKHFFIYKKNLPNRMNFRFIPCTRTSMSLDYVWDILLKQDNSTKRSIAFFHLSLSFTDFLLRNQFVFLIFFHCGFHLVIAFGEEGSYPIIQPYANKEQRNCGFCKYLRTKFQRNLLCYNLHELKNVLCYQSYSFVIFLWCWWRWFTMV